MVSTGEGGGIVSCPFRLFREDGSRETSDAGFSINSRQFYSGINVRIMYRRRRISCQIGWQTFHRDHRNRQAGCGGPGPWPDQSMSVPPAKLPEIFPPVSSRPTGCQGVGQGGRRDRKPVTVQRHQAPLAGNARPPCGSGACRCGVRRGGELWVRSRTAFQAGAGSSRQGDEARSV